MRDETTFRSLVSACGFNRLIMRTRPTGLHDKETDRPFSAGAYRADLNPTAGPSSLTGEAAARAAAARSPNPNDLIRSDSGYL